MSFAGLIHRRACLVPTWRGWLALLAVVGLAGFAAVRGIYGFLAIQDPVPGGLLVAEGWAPDYALVEALEEFRRHPYRGIYVTGVPIEHGGMLFDYMTFAERSAVVLIRLGAEPDKVHAVPAPNVRQDRTYATARTLRAWLASRGIPAEKVNVVSLGAHSRRTRLLYEKAFGTNTRVGVIAVAPRDFDPARWWRSSQGVRIVTGEIVAWLYARFVFNPPSDSAGR